MTPSPMPAGAGRQRLLLVDDEAEILTALRDLLEDSYDILATTSPVEALAMLGETPDVAVILSDQRMPDMPGNVFLTRAREVCSAEAILLTGYADLSAVVSAVNEGAISGYVHKPWEPEALLAMVDSAVERYRLRGALAFEQRAFAALTEQGPDAVSVIDRDGRLIRDNARKRNLPGWQDPDGTAASLARTADADALSSGIYSDEEARRLTHEGEERWIRTRRIPFGDGGHAAYLLKIESDETDRRIIEQKLHQSEKLQALGTLAGGIAHDFNNLLAVVIGNLELAARRGDDPDRLAQYLANATDAATRGSAISRRLLSFSRQRDLAAETFRPDHAIRGVEDILTQAMAGRASVSLDLASEIWAIRTDPSQFELAIVNLCINARDAMPEGGEVVVTVRNMESEAPRPVALSPGEYVRISVRDTGTGMTEEVKARVFEPFFTTKTQGRGTGLGLPMVHAMADAAGGGVAIDSALGEGTTIHLWLPRQTATAPAPAVTPEAREDKRLRILLAEDDLEVREMLAEQLRHAGHELVATDCAKDALALLEHDSNFELLITDYAMPGLSGGDLAQRVARDWPHLPVLLVTGFADLDRDDSLVVLTKPFTSGQLQTALRDALATRSA